jgi:hypothetical protein
MIVKWRLLTIKHYTVHGNVRYNCIYISLITLSNMFYLRYLCLFVYNGVQDILRCVFGLFFVLLSILCCQFLWIVHL